MANPKFPDTEWRQWGSMAVRRGDYSICRSLMPDGKWKYSLYRVDDTPFNEKPSEWLGNFDSGGEAVGLWELIR
jgi:hypothetical protein